MLLEFKRYGKGASSHQSLVHQELRQQGLRVEVVDSVERFEEILNAAIK